MPTGASAWMVWATTPAGAPSSMLVGLAGFECLWGGARALSPLPVGGRGGAQVVSAGLAVW